jgi:hypothetical protein
MQGRCLQCKSNMTNNERRSGPYADCYVLSNNRTKEFIYSFIDHFIPQREETADEYEIPQYSDSPVIVHKTADELIDYLVQNKNEIHTLYWRNIIEQDINGAMCFFTNDGNVILGLYCVTTSFDSVIENTCLQHLKSFCKSSDGYIAYEQPADHTTIEFLKKVNAFNAQSI